MANYTNDLFENIFTTYGSKSNYLKIISGYASATFLERIITQFPKMKIDLYIGMSSQGISITNHENYKNLVQQNEHVKVYYQFVGNPTHMKIYEFQTVTGDVQFVGSANFSENAFDKQREILCEVHENFDDLFDIQKSISLKCDNAKINEFIDFYVDESLNENSMEYTTKITNPEKSNSLIEDIKNPEKNSLITNENLKNLRIRSLYSTKFPIFDLEIVLAPTNQVLWASEGINARLDGKRPSIKVNNVDYFPENKVLELETPDGRMFNAELIGRFNNELAFIDTDIDTFVKQTIGFDGELISRALLENYGRTAIHFERLSETKYLMCL